MISTCEFFIIHMLRIGIDLGGTKIEIIALADDGSELVRRRIPTPQGDYQATLTALVGLVESVEHELGQFGSVGVGIPGAEALAGGCIKNANSVCLIGQPLRHDLQTRLQREIRIANDANCFALSEATDGAGAGCAVVFGAILGTGVGGGIVVHQRVLTGANHIAGEWGHNPLALQPAETPAPPACYCGRTDCIETWLSGPGLAADHVRQGGDHLSAEAIALRASTGDAACEATLQRYEKRLAKALAQVINILDPEIIVLGGGLSRLERLYTNVPRYWLAHVFSDQIATRLSPPRHGDASGVRGAAWLWDRR
jgi:fructokinase